MLTYVSSNAVSRNQSEKKINSLLEFLSQLKNMDILLQFYEMTLKSLEETQNERLWFKTNLKLCALYFTKKDFARLGKLVKELKK